MIDWNDLKYLLAVKAQRTLAAAGAELGVDPTTVGRRLTALEEQLGARLFDRTPEGFVPTMAGETLVAHAERMAEEALAAERELVGADQRRSGSVRLTATEMLATRFLAPHLGRFRRDHPEITLDLVCTNAIVSLARREADVALRLARPREENLVVKRLGRIDLALYASERYLAARGRPEDPDRSLAGHALLLFRETRQFARENAWLEARRDGAEIAMRSDSVSSVMGAVAGGAGIGLLPRVVGDAEPGLVRLPTEGAPAPREIWQSVHKDLAKNARVRAVLDFLGRVLAPPA